MSATAMTLPTSTTRCKACGRAIDGLTADLCQCITAQASFVCNHCGACLCRTTGAMKAFLRQAGGDVRERYEHERLRRRRRADRAMPAARVLVVDDDEEIREIAAFLIAGMGCRVSTADGAEQAMQIIGKESPDVVFTDALMPKTDGRALCRMIKDFNPRIKVAVMTSLYTAPRYKQEAHRLFRADAYLAKPVDVTVLREVLYRLTGGRVRRDGQPQ